MKATAVAPANIAFIKYWGKKDEALRLPLNSSLSMNLSGAYTTTTVEFPPNLLEDDIHMYSAPPRTKIQLPLKFGASKAIGSSEREKISHHLDRIRQKAKIWYKARVATINNFPSSAGLASSASGFAALTMAASEAFKLKLSEKELTVLARLGSGSACRSIPDGFVEWREGSSSGSSFAYSLLPSSYWKLCDVIAIVQNTPKDVSTSDGMSSIKTSPYWKGRINKIPDKIDRIKKALLEKNFQSLGEILEEDCLDMHRVLQTQNPPLYYWNDATIKIMENVRGWRKSGMPVYFTIDAGPNVHLICEAKDEKTLIEKVRNIFGVLEIISNKPAQGTKLSKKHLF